MKIKGAFPVRWAAKDGQGVTIVRTEVKYASSTSGTIHPLKGWQITVPEVKEGNYLWTWTHVEYSDGNHTDAYSVSRMGIDGKGIAESNVTYCEKSTNVSPENIPENEWGDFPSTLHDGYWLYTRTHILYESGYETNSYSVSQVGVGAYFAGMEERYAAGESATNPPDGYAEPGIYPSGTQIQTTWDQSRPLLTLEVPYLWNFEISRDSRGTAYVTAARCIGNFARGIQNIVQTYAISAYGVPQTGRDYPQDITEQMWSAEPQNAVPTGSKPYQWNKTVTSYNDGSSDTIYHVSAVKGQGAIYIDLDNENDSIMYDGSGQKVGSNAVSNIRLYDNGSDVTSGKTFSIYSKSSSVTASISGSVLTVTGITSNDGYVIVRCIYNSVAYYARMTIKRLQGVDKYELICTPSAIAYNSTTGVKSASSIVVQVYKTAQNGVRTLLPSFPPALGYSLTVDGTESISSYTSSKLTIALPTPIPASKTSYLIVLSQNGVTLDSENVPVNRTANGANGQDGDDGEDGNSITSDRFFFLLTETPSVPSANDSGWIEQGTSGCPTSGTESKPYLWKKESITYSKTADQNIISLVSVFGLSQRPQLLEQTAFDGDMDKWDIKNGTVVPLAKGEINGFGLVPSSGSTYQEILNQRVLEPAKFCKLEPDEYYTLSFFARDRQYVNLTDYRYGFGLREIYLRAGRYRLQVNGHCSAAAVSAGVKLTSFLFINNESGWIRNTQCSITGTNDVTATSSVLVVPEDATYKVYFVDYKEQGQGGTEQQTVTVNWWRIICDTNNNEFCTYLFPSNLASNALLMPSTWFVDGVAVNKTGTYTDGCVNWNLANDKQDSQGWAFHSVTFKTKSPIPESVVQHLRFRNLLNCYVEICMPKLEKSIMPTSWCRNENDSNGECSHNPCGKWVQGAIYYYCNGQRDVVRAPKTSSSNEETWWRMRRRTTSSGYVSNTQPYADTAHWESANNLKFTVVDAMFAQEIFTDKLVTSHAKSDNTDNPAWELLPDGSVHLAQGRFRIKDGNLIMGDNKLVMDTNGNITFAGNLNGAGGTFSGNLQAAGGIFMGGIRAPYKLLQSGKTLSLPDESCILYDGQYSSTITVPEVNYAFNGLEVKIVRLYSYSTATTTVHVNGTIVRAHNGSRVTGGLDISLPRGREIILVCSVFTYSGSTIGHWLWENSGDFV